MNKDPVFQTQYFKLENWKNPVQIDRGAGSFPRTSLTVHTVCYLAQALNKRKCAIKLKSLFPIWLNCRFGSSVCYFYSGTAEGLPGHGHFVRGKRLVKGGNF